MDARPPEPDIAKKLPQLDAVSGSSNSQILTRPIILGDLTLASPTTQTTVGAAGGASALPATPTGYITIMVGNSPFIIPYYAVS